MIKTLSPEESAEELAAERHDELLEVLSLSIKQDVGLAQTLKQTLNRLETLTKKDLAADLKIITAPIDELKKSVDELREAIQQSNRPKTFKIIRDVETDKISDVIVK